MVGCAGVGPRLLALLAAPVLLSCAGVSVSQDYDPELLPRFASYRSFDWFPGGRELTGNPQLDSPFLDQRVRAALVSQLAAKGFQKVEDRTPDFYVNYHLSVQTRLSSSGVNTYYGVGSYGSHGGFGIGLGTSPIRQYEEGTLVIDLVDVASRQLVWRGTGTRAVSRNPTPEETTRSIQEVVAEILKQFPPGAASRSHEPAFDHNGRRG
jgi:hypothetical protein